MDTVVNQWRITRGGGLNGTCISPIVLRERETVRDREGEREGERGVGKEWAGLSGVQIEFSFKLFNLVPMK